MPVDVVVVQTTEAVEASSKTELEVKVDVVALDLETVVAGEPTVDLHEEVAQTNQQAHKFIRQTPMVRKPHDPKQPAECTIIFIFHNPVHLNLHAWGFVL